MTGEGLAAGPDGEAIDQVREVLAALVSLLRGHEQSSEATWLEEVLAQLADPTVPPDSVREIFGKLHRIVSGMGGLTDINLEPRPGEEAWVATRELRRLAEELYELTR